MKLSMASEILPSDLLYEIFSRLPIKSLLRFRCVSSVCCSIIDDPYLAYMHQTRSAEEPNFLVFHHPWDRTDVMFRREGNFSKDKLHSVSKFATLQTYNLECGCNGLSCFTEVTDNSVVVLFNPLREQLLYLPPTPSAIPISQRPFPPPKGKITYGLGFDSSKNMFKIVRVFDDETSSTNSYTEVFTLGTSSWKAISKGPPCHLFKKKFSCKRFCTSVFVRGNIHWLSYPEEDAHEGRSEFTKIVSFDISKEEFGLIYAPKLRECHLLDLNGNLAIVDCSSTYNRPHIDIWVLKEYERKDYWVKEYEIDLKPPIRSEFKFFSNLLIEVVGLVECGQVLILRHRGLFISCDPKTGSLRDVCIPKFSYCTDVLCLKGSLLSISKFEAN